LPCIVQRLPPGLTNHLWVDASHQSFHVHSSP
jgi:hypothetical protein